MTVELAPPLEEQLRELALKQGREIDLLLEEAVRDYLVAVSITDLTSAEVAETQTALTGELAGLSPWSDEAR